MYYIKVTNQINMLYKKLMYDELYSHFSEKIQLNKIKINSTKYTYIN